MMNKNYTEEAVQNRVKAEAVCEIINKLEWLKNDYIANEYDDNNNVIAYTIVDGWHDTGYGKTLINLVNELEKVLLK